MNIKLKKLRIISFFITLAIIFTSIPLGIAKATNDAVLNPIVKITFDDESAKDFSGRENDGHLIGELEFIDSFSGKAIHIDNTDITDEDRDFRYIDFGQEEDLKFGDENFTIMFWYRSDHSQSKEYTIVSNGIGNSDDAGFAIGGIQNEIILNFRANESEETLGIKHTINLIDDSWHHIAAVFDRSSNMILYIDGDNCGEIDISEQMGLSIDTQNDFILGGNANKDNMLEDAYIDEFVVFNSALSLDDILNYNSPYILLNESYEHEIEDSETENNETENNEFDISMGEEESEIDEEIDEDIDEDIVSEITESMEYEVIPEPIEELTEDNDINLDDALLTFEVISDTHIPGDDLNSANNKKLIGVLDFLKEDFPETSLVMHCGDFTNNGTEIQMNGYYNILKKYDKDFYFMTCLGNHDVGLGNHNNEGISYWYDTYERYMRYNKKYMGDTGDKVYHDKWIDGYHFIMLNTEWSLHLQSYISAEQLEWLDKTMAENADPNKPIFVGLHQPLCDTFEVSNKWPVGVQDHAIKEVLRKYPQTILFTGHLHDGLGKVEVLETDFGTMVNVPAMRDNTQGDPQGGIGFHVTVYKDQVKLNLRDYLNDKWIPEYSYTIDLDPSTKPRGKILDVNFDDGTARDISGNGNHGEIIGDLEFVEGINGGKAIHIVNPDTSDEASIKAEQYIKFSDKIKFGSDDFTLMFLYKGSFPSMGNSAILSNTSLDSENNFPGFNIGNFKNSSGIALNIKTQANTNIATKHCDWTEDGNWHAVTAVFNRTGDMILYIDGKRAASQNISGQKQGTLDNEVYNLIIGADGNAENGAKDIYIDDLKIYKGALGAGEIETTWYPYDVKSGINHITISWFNNPDDTTEPAYILIDGKKSIDIKSGDTSVTIKNLKSNSLYNVNLVTRRKVNRNQAFDVFPFVIKTKESNDNKDRLIDVYELYKNKSRNEYTEEDWRVFESALDEAVKVLENEEATDTEIQMATKALEKAGKAGWNYVDGKWYYKNIDDKKQTGWIKVGSKWYYMDDEGVMQTGWQKVGNESYYMKSNGEMVTGEFSIKDEINLFADSGKWQGVWKNDSKGKWFKYPNGKYPKNQWTILAGEWYHFDNNGYVGISWQKISGKWYYMNSEGIMQTGWQKVSGKWYYMNSSGVMQTGWQQIGGKWYYLKSNGEMAKGWVSIGGKWYYMNSSGAMKTGWQKVSSKWYYMNGSGVMQTGWQKVSGKWYYMNGSGVMQTGWQQIGSKWYYMDGSGAMKANTTVGGYKLGKDGAWIH